MWGEDIFVGLVAGAVVHGFAPLKCQCPFYRNSSVAGNAILVRFEHLERSPLEPKMTLLKILQCLCTALSVLFALRACCYYMKA